MISKKSRPVIYEDNKQSRLERKGVKAGEKKWGGSE